MTVFALSVKKSGFETLTFPAPLSSQTVHVYLMTPVGSSGLTSKLVDLVFYMLNLSKENGHKQKKICCISVIIPLK